MARVSTNCVAVEEKDGSATLKIEVVGLTMEEALSLGKAIADPIKIATLQAIRGRLTPQSFVVDSRNSDVPLCLDEGSGP